MGTLEYVRNFAKDRYIASITPTSEFGVRRVCRRIDFPRAETIVEFGPGNGVFTSYILDRLPKDSLLIAIERNRRFVEALKARVKDPRLVVVEGCASDVAEDLRRCGVGKADYIVSGIPFSFINGDVKGRILRNTREALREGGKFLAYQMFYQPPGALRIPLERLFGAVSVGYEILNIPPLSIYEAVRGRDRQDG